MVFIMSAFFEYKKFLAANQLTLSDDEKKIANLILINFEQIKSKSRSAGSRSKLIAKLLQEKSGELKANINLQEISNHKSNKINKITKLIISNFRGFQEEHTFDLSKKNNFIFGENGSGKSSFFEALEYSLTGNISEASGKRISLNNYIKNSETKKKPDVKLYVDTISGESEVNKNFSENSSILIEKNRIEGFSRVSSYTRSVQQERLSILFGTDEFSNFCTNFAPLSSYLLPLEKQKKTLESYESIRKINQHNLDNSIKSIDASIREGRNILNNSEYKNETSKSLLDKLIGNSDNDQGLIEIERQKLEQLNKVKPIDERVIQAFGTTLDKLKKTITIIDKTSKEISGFKDKISLKSLYEYIVQTKNILDNNRCPACQSIIRDFSGQLLLEKDPFNYAKLMGEELSFFKNKEDNLNLAKKEFDNLIPTFYSSLTKVNEVSKIKLDRDIKYSNYKEIKDSINNLESFYLQSKLEAEKFNITIKTSLDEANKIKQRINKLEILKTKLTELRTKYKIALANKKEVEEKTEKTNELIRNIQPLVNIENERNTYNNALNVAYSSLIDRLKKYNENLPIELASELSELTLEIYNSINKHNFDHEVIKCLTLPSKPENDIQIEFLDGTKDNALKILSEGHLKCLGLSILLAKNIKDNQKIIIFDDVVNAIDDEHRKGVRDTLLTNENIINHQFIITTHAAEFLSLLENMVGDYKSEVNRYDFCNRSNGRKVSLKITSPGSYIIKARGSFENNDPRDCLMNLRRTLEFLAPAIWKKLAKKNYDSNISMLFYGPNFEPNLSNYLEALRKKIATLNKKDDTNQLAEFEEILTKIINLKEKNKLIRMFLNKATHFEEKEEEFDNNEVEVILILIERLNNITLNK
ncbi:hypothetical protein GLP27_05775 [Photobacterium carnosum]|nr:hypothetical protein [Photobacterium carnosum]